MESHGVSIENIYVAFPLMFFAHVKFHGKFSVKFPWKIFHGTFFMEFYEV